MTDTPTDQQFATLDAVSIADQMPQRDRWSTRAVVLILGAVIMLTVSIAGALLMTDRTVPSEMWILISTPLGAVGALLSSTRTR